MHTMLRAELEYTKNFIIRTLILIQIDEDQAPYLHYPYY